VKVSDVPSAHANSAISDRKTTAKPRPHNEQDKLDQIVTHIKNEEIESLAHFYFFFWDTQTMMLTLHHCLLLYQKLLRLQLQPQRLTNVHL
jgi:hypothetical protein